MLFELFFSLMLKVGEIFFVVFQMLIITLLKHFQFIKLEFVFKVFDFLVKHANFNIFLLKLPFNK